MKEISYLKNNKQKGNSYRKPYDTKKHNPKKFKREAKSNVKQQVREILKMDHDDYDDFYVIDARVIEGNKSEKETMYDYPLYEDNKGVDAVMDPNTENISKILSK